MEQDMNMNVGATGAPPTNPYATLQASVPPQTYKAMEAIFNSFDQHFTLLESATLSAQVIQDAIQAGFANANFNVTVQAPIPPQHTQQSSHSVLSAPRMTLQLFHGKRTDNVQGWISLAKEALTASQVPPDHWTYVVVQSLRDLAATWYLAKKKENQNKTPLWSKMKKAMLAQWDNPARVNKLRMCLDGLSCKNKSIAEYARQFQEIELQIPPEDMSMGDRIYKFLTHLPEELYMQLIHRPDREMSAYYSAARMWEGLQKIPQQIAAASRTGFRKPHKRPRPPPSLLQYDAPTTMPYLPSAAPPPTVTEPMDLDAMAVARDPRKTPSTICCYNCNEFGHLAWDCQKPQHCQTPSTENRSFRGHPQLMKPMHLFKDIEEGSYASSDEEYVPEEFNPDKPDCYITVGTFT